MNPHIWRMLECTFSLDASKMYRCIYVNAEVLTLQKKKKKKKKKKETLRRDYILRVAHTKDEQNAPVLWE